MVSLKWLPYYKWLSQFHQECKITKSGPRVQAPSPQKAQQGKRPNPIQQTGRPPVALIATSNVVLLFLECYSMVGLS
ncbi:hypothetical protein RIF29_37693 [Crotalaria pallida]|uniref:Uncharacterized protein n=1 Tax=Crotalaria pallida TaxID=3830 RepID=A0AAN9ECN3_CROPI